MKKYILWIIFILFLILCAEYIRFRYVHKHFQDTYMDYTSAIPIKEDILKIKESVTEECKANKLAGGKALLEMCAIEAKDPNNFKNKFGDNY